MFVTLLLQFTSTLWFVLSEFSPFLKPNGLALTFFDLCYEYAWLESWLRCVSSVPVDNDCNNT